MQCWNWGQDLRTSSRPKQDTCGRCGSVSFKVKSTSKPGGRKQKKNVDYMTTWSIVAKSLEKTRKRHVWSKPISAKALSKAFLHLPARFMVGIPQLFVHQKSHQSHDPKIPKWPLGKAPVNLDVVRGWRHLSSTTTIDNDLKKGRLCECKCCTYAKHSWSIYTIVFPFLYVHFYVL